MRLNKFLASIGVCSRREADKAIEAGRVMINGQVVELGATVGDEDLVSFDGRYIGMGKDVEKIKPIIIAFNKPEGLVCTTSGGSTYQAFRLIKSYYYRLYLLYILAHTYISAVKAYKVLITHCGSKLYHLSVYHNSAGFYSFVSFSSGADTYTCQKFI